MPRAGGPPAGPPARRPLGAWSELGELVTDDMVSALAVTGSPSACAQQLVERLGGLADRVALFLPFQCSEETLTQLVAELRAASA